MALGLSGLWINRGRYHITYWTGKRVRRGSGSIKMHQKKSELTYNNPEKMVFRRVGDISDSTPFYICRFLNY